MTMKKSNQARCYYPIFLNVKGKRCVVVGGGQVALRKVRMLVEHKADIEVISPVLCPKLQELADNEQIQVIPRQYQTGDLQRAIIVISATDDADINREVIKEARQSAILINVVDNPEKSDFIVPSYLRQGDISVAISTGGRSPALARKIRTILERELGSESTSLLDLIGEVRAEVKSLQMGIGGDAWQEALDLKLLKKSLKNEGKEAAKSILLNRLKNAQQATQGK